MKDSKIKVQWDLLRLKCRDCGAFWKSKMGNGVVSMVVFHILNAIIA